MSKLYLEEFFQRTNLKKCPELLDHYNSRYKRIKRFFKDFKIAFPLVASWVVQFFGLTNKPLYLSMDRTNWQWGKKNINILMLSITYKGIAIPLFWSLLDKKRNSNTKERIAIMDRFIMQFGKDNIAGLLADREFRFRLVSVA